MQERSIVPAHNISLVSNRETQGGLFVGAMQPGLGLVYGGSKYYRQHRPPPGPNRLYEQGDAAGILVIPRSETLCRLHRPYKEQSRSEQSFLPLVALRAIDESLHNILAPGVPAIPRLHSL